MVSRALEALERLRSGNDAFVAGRPPPPDTGPARRAALVAAQTPFAIVLGCSDSRVPPELIFGQGLGDLFVIRAAGNVVTPVLAGSIEFAAESLGSRLVVVLGHSSCVAVSATVEQMRRPDPGLSPHLRGIVERVRPAVEEVAADGLDGEELLSRATRANVRRSVATLRRSSEILARLERDDGLRLVGAEYSLATGRVEFLEPPDA